MAYVKTIWKDSPDETTPLNSANLNKIENGIATLDAEKTTALLATNLVTNGDFSNGTTGWTSQNSTSTVASNTLTNTGNGASIQAFITQNYAFVNAQKYYLKVKVRVTNAVCTQITFGSVSTVTLGQAVNNPIQNQWYDISGILTALSDTYIRLRHYYADSAAQNGKVMEVQYVSAINLTTIFSAGNEPTKEQMDWLLAQRFTNSWFDGTKELATAKELIKLAQVQSSYVTPTLLNSRTGTLKYLLTNDGFVDLKGTASGGSLNTDIIVLPTGYRPSETLTFPIVANNTFGVVTISSAGLVRQTVGALTNVSLDGITFKVAQ